VLSDIPFKVDPYEAITNCSPKFNKVVELANEVRLSKLELRASIVEQAIAAKNEAPSATSELVPLEISEQAKNLSQKIQVATLDLSQKYRLLLMEISKLAGIDFYQAYYCADHNGAEFPVFEQNFMERVEEPKSPEGWSWLNPASVGGYLWNNMNYDGTLNLSFAEVANIAQVTADRDRTIFYEEMQSTNVNDLLEILSLIKYYKSL
jgi:hypothetical protein